MHWPATLKFEAPPLQRTSYRTEGRLSVRNKRKNGTDKLVSRRGKCEVVTARSGLSAVHKRGASNSVTPMKYTILCIRGGPVIVSHPWSTPYWDDWWTTGCESDKLCCRAQTNITIEHERGRVQSNIQLEHWASECSVFLYVFACLCVALSFCSSS